MALATQSLWVQFTVKTHTDKVYSLNALYIFWIISQMQNVKTRILKILIQIHYNNPLLLHLLTPTSILCVFFSSVSLIRAEKWSSRAECESRLGDAYVTVAGKIHRR